MRFELPPVRDDRLFSGILALLMAACLMMKSDSEAADTAATWRERDKILFQGDSITDADRGADGGPDNGLGHGYVSLIAARLAAAHPTLRLVIGNRGVSGNKIHDLAERWDADTIALRPDVLSILIGINDTAAEMLLDEYEGAYDALLEETKAKLPDVRLVLCEPFGLLPNEADGRPNVWETDVRKRARVVERLAAKYGAAFVRFQDVLDAARKRAPAEHWLYDGIHPTPDGHQLMADEWIRVVTSFKWGKPDAKSEGRAR